MTRFCFHLLLIYANLFPSDFAYSQTANPKTKTSVFISLSNYTPDFGFRKNFSVNLNDELIMRDVDPSNAPGHTWQVGLRTRVGKKSHIVYGIRYSADKQALQYRNLKNTEDRQVFGGGSFLIYSWLYEHRRLGPSFAVNHPIWKGIYLEAGISPTINVSKKVSMSSLGHLGIDSIYREVMFQNMRQYSNFSLFAHINIGYNWKGIFAAFHYEEHLNKFERSFTFRGNNYTVRQPHWINKGFTVGYAYTFKKRLQKETPKI